MPTHKRRVLSGHKINNRHSTFIQAAEPVIVAAKRRPEVSKVVLGPIRNIGAGVSRITYKPIPAGLSVTVRGNLAVQNLYIYTSDAEATRTALEREVD